MISFYFKGGYTHLGCEFAYKSFREYLFAECIVETLKDYGREQTRALAEREPYWKDFEREDRRYRLSRDLSRLLAPQWLKPEVIDHLQQLIQWEISRLKEGDAGKEIGLQTRPLDIAGWERVRDGLADIWDWWGEGVHLRPQPARDRLRRTLIFQEPFVCELIQYSAPLDTGQGTTLPEPARTTTMDAHLGGGLCRLCAFVHYYIAGAQGWWRWHNEQAAYDPRDLWKGASGPGAGPRRYQTSVKQDQTKWVLFAPSGKKPEYFANYISRINGAGWRPQGSFPGEVFLEVVDLRDTILVGVRLDGARLDGASLDGASLDWAILVGATGLTWEQIDRAIISEETRVPPEFEQLKQDKLSRQRTQK